MKYLFFSVLLSSLFVWNVNAQQDAQFSQYMQNILFYNPAAAGVSQRWTQINAIHRSQWVGYDATFDDGGAPTTQVFSIDMPLTKYKLGTGLHFVHDQLGLVRNVEVQLSVAYHLKLSPGLLSIGVRGGAYNYSLVT
ncbi:MAG: PorP/SprF family type IX secretion system membrane protein, partial [Flammeovirgaceae bacterium]|nr:PorP/SprF family type IX secretion system membrane protein [Flammeovirgaceae bacterium]